MYDHLAATHYKAIVITASGDSTLGRYILGLGKSSISLHWYFIATNGE